MVCAHELVSTYIMSNVLIQTSTQNLQPWHRRPQAFVLSQMALILRPGLAASSLG